MTFATLEQVPGKKLVRKIVGEKMPFGGTWTFTIERDGPENRPENQQETVLTITENGEVYNPVFRFVSRFILGHYSSLDRYLEQLRKRLSET